MPDGAEDRGMLRHAIPVLHVNSSAVAEAFYSGLLGFRKRFDYRPDETRPDPCYMASFRPAVGALTFRGTGLRRFFQYNRGLR